jgi:hypothetical protein
MALSTTNKDAIQQIIKSCLRNKFQKYKPESYYMPFHFHLLGKDRMALYSFIHSINTSFGTSIFEPVAIELAKNRFKIAKSQYVVGNSISEGCQQAIQTIMNNLSIGNNPNKKNEVTEIRKSAILGSNNKIKTVKVDLFLEDKDGEQYLFDLKTTKPNLSNFKDFKRTLLEWTGIALTQNNNAKVNTLIAIPYNPYEPLPYQRWTMKGMLDNKYELKVAEEFWDFIGGKGAYKDLLDCFEKAGIELRPEIDEYFSHFRKV